MKETNHTGSRKTNKHWTGAKNDLALPVTLQFISSTSWRQIEDSFFHVLYVSPCRVLKNDKGQRRKEATLSKGISALAIAISQGKQTWGHISGHCHQCHPSWHQLSPAPVPTQSLAAEGGEQGAGGYPGYSKTPSRWPPGTPINALLNNALEVHAGQSNTNGSKLKVYQQTSTSSMAKGGCWVKIKWLWKEIEEHEPY